MSAKAAGSKAGRRERHLARQAALKERKVLRKKRAAIHAAMGAAAKMQRSKRKGTRDFDENMRALGFEPLVRGSNRVTGRAIPRCDVLDKYETQS